MITLKDKLSSGVWANEVQVHNPVTERYRQMEFITPVKLGECYIS